MNDGLTCNKVLSLALRAGTGTTIYAGTEGGSVFKMATGAGVADGSPIANRLGGCSPNPSATGTSVNYELAHYGPVELTVHDVSGRLVRLLESGPRQRGIHAVRWDGTDNRGEAMPAGVYFVRFAAGDRVSTGRLTLIR